MRGHKFSEVEALRAPKVARRATLSLRSDTPPFYRTLSSPIEPHRRYRCALSCPVKPYRRYRRYRCALSPLSALSNPIAAIAVPCGL